MNDLTITNRDKALQAMQKIELEGLAEIDRICRKYDIKYSLGGGTCLGQIRHGGIIPWDDDIDVDMTVDNYDRFVEVAPKELEGSHFFLRCRKTDPTHLRSACRLENTETRLSLPRWSSAHKEAGVFVDIFRWNYLPDNPEERKKLASRLFWIHCMQSYKEYGKYAAKLDKKYRISLRIMCALVPTKKLEDYEEKVIHRHKDKTGWIIDDAIIHGDHGGYLSDGIDEYEDVMFEGLKVMNKKNSHNFLRTIYGEDYNTWLPPEKRISHHKWTTIDFGPYAEKFNLDENYKDSMTTNFSEAKLRRMKEVSDFMVEDIISVCRKEGIPFHVAGLSDEAVGKSFPEIREYWTGPAKILMLREDFERFEAVCQEALGEKYFLQTHKTDPYYFMPYARVLLTFTELRVHKIKPAMEEKMHKGFFVEIIPLDSVRSDQAADTVAAVRKAFRELRIRWRCARPYDFIKLGKKDQLRYLKVKRHTVEELYSRLEKLSTQYNGDCEADACFDSCMQLGGSVFTKTELANQQEVKILAREAEDVHTVEELIAKVSKGYGPCYLTYYDIPDYQLSILRYDEKTGQLLTNEQILEQYAQHKEKG